MRLPNKAMDLSGSAALRRQVMAGVSLRNREMGRRRPSGLAIAACLLLITGSGRYGRCEASNDPQADSLVSVLRAAPCVQAYLLDPSITHRVLDGDGPHIRTFRIVGLGPVLNEEQRVYLCDLVAEAAGQRCGPRSDCIFTPRYAFRFMAEGVPVDLQIGSTCSEWWFACGNEELKVIRPSTVCVRDSLEQFVGAVFGEGSENE